MAHAGPDDRTPSRRTVLGGALAGAAGAAALAGTPLAAAAGVPGTAAAAAAHPAARSRVDYHAWREAADWRGGEAAGVRTAERGHRCGLVVGRPIGTSRYTDPHTGTTRDWEYATWTSPSRRLPFGATQAVVSWNADTPPGTWIEVELQAAYPDGGLTPWYTMGRWARGDADIRRTSVDGQHDAHTAVSTDTLEIRRPAAGRDRLTAYRVRLTLRRRPGSAATPFVRRVGVMASAVPERFTVPAGRPGTARGVELRLPRYSQQIHRGEYPRYNGGGEAWCSPTSSEMVVEYFGKRPGPAQLAWVRRGYPDPSVCEAARGTYDYQYRGCGNWPFNTAYAAGYGLEAAVTRLHGLQDAERLVAAGLPVITSQSFLAAELPGAGYGTAGHLMVVTGFTAGGDVVVHDPAAPSDAVVRRVYPRHPFETVWLRTRRYRADRSIGRGSGGAVYLIWPTEPTAAQRAALASVGVR